MTFSNIPSRMRPKVSIIIPVFNTERYLQQCLNSVVSQSLHEIEIICINDGSTDNSWNILREFEKKDPRFILLNNYTNRGSAIARNSAIQQATGEYLGFVDSDDWIKPNMYEELYSSATKYSSDLIICENLLYNQETETFWQPQYCKLPIAEHFKQRSFHWTQITDTLFKINSGPTNKLYKREFVKLIGAKFADKLRYNDIYFVYKCILRAEMISVIPNPLYVYRYLRPGSITAQSGIVHFDIFQVMNLLEKEIYPFKENQKLYSVFQKYKIREYFLHYNLLESKLKAEFLKKIKFEIYNNSNDNKLTSKFSYLLIFINLWLIGKIKHFSEFILGSKSNNFLLYLGKIKFRLLSIFNFKNKL